MVAFVGKFLAEGFLPDGGTAGAVDAENGKLENFGRFDAAHATAATAGAAATAFAGSVRWWSLCRWIADLRFLRFLSRRDGGLDEDEITPNDGSGGSVAGQFDFPF